MKFPSSGAQVLGSAGARSPALQPPLRFPAMAPGARAGAARGGHPPARSKRLDLDYPGRSRRELRALASPPPPRHPLEPPGPALNFPNEQAPGHLPPFRGVSFSPFRFQAPAGHDPGLDTPGQESPGPTPAEPGGSPPTPQQQGARPIGRRWHRERRRAPRPQSPGPFWPPSNLQQSWPQVAATEFSGARASPPQRAPGRGPGRPGAWLGPPSRIVSPRAARSCSPCTPVPRQRPAARARAPLSQATRRRPPRGSRTRRGGYPSAPGHARSRRRSFLPRGNSRPYFPPGGRTSPSPPALLGPRSLAKGSGSSRPLQ